TCTGVAAMASVLARIRFHIVSTFSSAERRSFDHANGFASRGALSFSLFVSELILAGLWFARYLAEVLFDRGAEVGGKLLADLLQRGFAFLRRKRTPIGLIPDILPINFTF